MRAIQLSEVGGPQVLRPAEVPAPEPGPGDVLVRLAASGVNFIDVYHRIGRYPLPLPFVPGVEGAGRVAAVGAEVAGVAVGDRVAWVNIPGGYAEYAVLPAERVIPLPEVIDDETAAGALLQGITAHYLTHSSYPVQPGDTVLVHAAAGGTGQLLTQLATALGARVIGTASTPAKAELAREAGAIEVLGPGDADLPARVRELTGGRGVAAAYDGVGAATFEASLAALRIRGTLALFGAASGPELS